MRKNRLRKNKKQAMTRRMRSCKKPMSSEQKEARKKLSEIQRAKTKARLAKK